MAVSAGHLINIFLPEVTSWHFHPHALLCANDSWYTVGPYPQQHLMRGTSQSVRQGVLAKTWSHRSLLSSPRALPRPPDTLGSNT